MNIEKEKDGSLSIDEPTINGYGWSLRVTPDSWRINFASAIEDEADVTDYDEGAPTEWKTALWNGYCRFIDAGEISPDFSEKLESFAADYDGLSRIED